MNDERRDRVFPLPPTTLPADSTPRLNPEQGAWPAYNPTMPDTDPNAERRGLKPFLSLSPRLFLTTFNPALLPLVFTIIHIANTRSSTAELAASLKQSLYKACGGIASGAAVLQTLPRYLAMQTNEQVDKATRATVLAVGLALMNCIQIIEAVVNFIIDTYRSMLLCTIQLVVQGTLEILIAAVKEISDAVTSSLNTIRSNIQDDIASGNNLIQKAAHAIDSVTSKIGMDFSIPDITIPSLSWLENVTIPTGFEDSLVKLNASLPSLDQLKNKMEELVDIPFEKLILEINSTRLEIAAGINESMYPVPSLKSLSSHNVQSLQDELCGDINTGFIDDTAKALYNLGTVAIGVMICVLLLGWCLLSFWQWQRWRALRGTVEAVESEWASTRERPDAWTVVAVVEHPVMERWGRPVLDKLRVAPRTRSNLRWFLSYLGHPTCLALLFMSVVGLIALECQIAALHVIKDHAERSANATIMSSANDFSAKLNALSSQASAEYATDMNNAITSLQHRINDELFGTWINSTAVTLNSTLVEFYAEVQSVLVTAFGNTILYNPINTFVYCILGSKITTLEKGLTWVSEHAHITLPTVPIDVLQLSKQSTEELATPLAAAAVGGDNGDGGAIDKLVNHFESALKAERMIYTILLALYGLVVLVGLLIVIWHSGGAEKYAAWRDRRKRSDDVQEEASRSFVDLGQNRRSPWQRIPPLFKLYSRSTKKDLPQQSEVESEKISWATRTPSPDEVALRELAAPGQAYLAHGGYVTPSPYPSPERGTRDLPPLPREAERQPGGSGAVGWQTATKSSTRAGTPAPEPPARNLSIANRGEYAASVSDVSFRPLTPQRTPQSQATTSRSAKRPIKTLLLSPTERRKRELEAQVDPFITPAEFVAPSPFDDGDPFLDGPTTQAKGKWKARRSSSSNPFETRAEDLPPALR